MDVGAITSLFVRLGEECMIGTLIVTVLAMTWHVRLDAPVHATVTTDGSSWLDSSSRIWCIDLVVEPVHGQLP